MKPKIFKVERISQGSYNPESPWAKVMFCFMKQLPKGCYLPLRELGILPCYQKDFLNLTVLLRILIVLWKRRISRFSKPNEYLYDILEQDVDEDMILGSINYLEVVSWTKKNEFKRKWINQDVLGAYKEDIKNLEND